MDMKYMLLFILCFLSDNSFLYWGDLSKTEQDDFTQYMVKNENVSNYLKGNLEMIDNSRTILLLNTLSNLSADEKTKALYFDLFNQICKKTDGELGETLGVYCQKIFLIDTEYVIYYLKTHPKLSNKYAELLGMEFYFKDDGTSEMKYNFRDFQSLINKRLCNKPEYQSFLVSFYNEISLVIKNME